MASVLAVTWAFGLIEPLHPGGSRDSSRNVTTTDTGVAGGPLGVAG